MNKSYKLFELLRKNTAQGISALFEEALFIRGRSYQAEHRVEAFIWDPLEDGCLTVHVRGQQLYTVKIILANGNLRFVCNCPAWLRERACKHIVCTLLTAREELAAPEMDSEQEVELPVTANMADLQNITIHLSPQKNVWQLTNPGFTIAFMRGQKKLSTQDLPAMSLEEALSIVGGKNYNSEERFYELLASKGKFGYPMTVHTEQGPVDITWNSEPVAAVVELDFIDDRVQVRRLIMQKTKVVLHDFIRIGKQFIVDLTTKQLLKIDVLSWPWCEQILYDHVVAVERGIQRNEEIQRAVASSSLHFAPVSTPLLITIQQFNEQYPIHFPSQQYAFYTSIFITKQNGVIVSLPLQNPTIIVDGIVQFEEREITLSVFGMINDYRPKPSFSLMEYVRAIDYSLPNFLSTKKRKTIIVNGFCALMTARSESAANSLIKKIIDELRDSVATSQRYGEVRKFLTDFYIHFAAASREAIVIHDQEFHRVMLDSKQMANALTIMWQFFGKKYFNELGREHPSLKLPLDVFYQRVAELKTLLSVHSIDLRMNNKPLQMLVLDISVNATRSRGDDWLDVEPHILADGVVLSEEQREVLFSKDGKLIESAHCIQLLDPVSQEIIKMLARMFMQRGNTGQLNERQGIVEMPRLRVLDLLELRQKGAKVLLRQEDEDLLARLTNFSKIDKIAVPKGFVGTLRDYQNDGYRWLAFLYKNRFGACLADDMGLGKTIQTIALLGGIVEGIVASNAAQHAPHLIVVPPTLIFNWQHELQIFYPGLRVMAYGSKEQHDDFANYDVVLATYDRIRLDIEFLRDTQFHVLILDEAQAIKNIEAARTAAIRQLKSVFTISLTGTPLENHLGEYHSIIDVAVPGLLPSYKLFMKHVQDETHEPFIKKTRPFVLRRTKEAVLVDLPEKTESNVFLTMDTKQQKVYATTVAEVKRLIDQAYETKTTGQASIIALTAILRLRQICISPQMIDKTKESPSPKIEYLTSSLESIVGEGSAALVFSQFTTCLDLIETALKKAGIAYYRIDGKTTMPSRRKIVESFQANDAGTAVLLLSLKTGGVGLNLTRANYVFHVDPWWNPAVENQASDRSHRIGQKNKVFVSRLVMHHTIEEKMMLLKETKQKLFSEIMEHAENKTKSIITKRDFDLLLS